MAQAGRADPYVGFNFVVEIDGIQLAGFSECSGLSAETAVIEYREGNEPARARKLPGLTKYTEIVLKRGLTQRECAAALGNNCPSRRGAKSSRSLAIHGWLAVEVGRPQFKRQDERSCH
jgi:phage tail-like protein